MFRMVHLYKPANSVDKPIFVLLHGMGGTERDLIPLTTMIDSQAGYLSLRGNVLENGVIRRYFKRIAAGQFDQIDLEARTLELYETIEQASIHYGFSLSNVILLGYSNGANIAGSLLFRIPTPIQRAVLLHPMVPVRSITPPSLSHLSVFIGAGRNDSICPPQESLELHQLLSQAGATVQLHWTTGGHSITEDELLALRQWVLAQQR